VSFTTHTTPPLSPLSVENAANTGAGSTIRDILAVCNSLNEPIDQGNNGGLITPIKNNSLQRSV